MAKEIKIIEISFNGKLQESVVDALQVKIESITKLMESCLKQKQTDAATSLNKEIRSIQELQEEIKNYGEE